MGSRAQRNSLSESLFDEGKRKEFLADAVEVLDAEAPDNAAERGRPARERARKGKEPLEADDDPQGS